MKRSAMNVKPLRALLTGLAVGACVALGACAGTPARPITTVAHLDLDRFMGDWYVIASIPTFLERDAHNAVESYRLAADGTVATTFSFNAGSFDGKRRVYHPTGYVADHRSNAVWGMMFLWPLKSEYRVLWLAPDYAQTIIGRSKRDYVWIMARTPSIPDADFRAHLRFLEDEGYDVARVQLVPQRWPAGRLDPAAAAR
jgi:apolipoprotein D and lipocalin family protein